MSAPVRIQLRRTKGWRMPANTVSVARPTQYGNPFKVDVDGTAEQCVSMMRADIDRTTNRGTPLERAVVVTALRRLRGKNLACWCKLDQPCHADLLLELANGPLAQ